MSALRLLVPDLLLEMSDPLPLLSVFVANFIDHLNDLENDRYESDDYCQRRPDRDVPYPSRLGPRFLGGALS